MPADQQAITMNINMNKAALLAAALAVGACATLTPPPDSTEIRRQLLSSHSEILALPEQREIAVEQLLQHSLTPQTAAQLMVLNSPGVEVLLAQLGVANAQRAQAGLITNPQVAIGALRPEGGGRWQLDLGLSQSLLDLLTRSLRMTLAEATLAQRQLELQLTLDEALNELQSTYFAAIAAQQQLALYRQRQEVGEAAYALAQQMRAAGTLPPAHFYSQQFTSQQLALETRRAQLAADTMRLQLASQLGLKPQQTFKLPDQLPDIPQDVFNVTDLVASAQQHRPDLRLARHQQDLLSYQQPLLLRSRWADISAGMNVEREFDGSVNTGPELEFGLPLFDRGQARMARLKSETSAAHAQEAYLLHMIEHDIARALRQLDNAQQAYQQVTAMQQTAEKQLNESQREVNFMLASPFDLLTLKQQQLLLETERVAVLKQYWQARTSLALATGKNIPIPEQHGVTLRAEPDLDHETHHHGAHHHD